MISPLFGWLGVSSRTSRPSPASAGRIARPSRGLAGLCPCVRQARGDRRQYLVRRRQQVPRQRWQQPELDGRQMRGAPPADRRQRIEEILHECERVDDPGGPGAVAGSSPRGVGPAAGPPSADRHGPAAVAGRRSRRGSISPIQTVRRCGAARAHAGYDGQIVVDEQHGLLVQADVAFRPATTASSLPRRSRRHGDDRENSRCRRGRQRVLQRRGTGEDDGRGDAGAGARARAGGPQPTLCQGALRVCGRGECLCLSRRASPAVPADLRRSAVAGVSVGRRHLWCVRTLSGMHAGPQWP